MMADPQNGRILGAAVIGPQGSELIHEVIVAMSFDATVDQFMRIPHLHPTLAEIWTYPAEICAAQLGREDSRRRAGGDGDERRPVSDSARASARRDRPDEAGEGAVRSEISRERARRSRSSPPIRPI